MAINKVINRKTSSHKAMKNVISYVLKDEKVKEGYVEINGPYPAESINSKDILNTWIAEKKLWNKDSGRMYAHNVISFHKDENISPAEVLEIGKAFTDKFFPDHQCLIGVHQDKDHLHCHIVTNTVSYINGLKLHQTKHDLELQKNYTNQLCLEHGLSVAEKGRHFDGSSIDQGEIITWSKDKYNLTINESQKSYLVDCALVITDVLEAGCKSQDEFVSHMTDRGWSVAWTDNKKHITFENDEGKKVRDSNISKTFSMDIGKEALYAEFERQKELEAKRKREQEREYYKKYYAQLESVSTGTRSYTEAVRSFGENNTGAESVAGRRETGRSGRDSSAIIRDIKSTISITGLKEANAGADRTDKELERSDRDAERKRRAVEESRRAEQERQARDAERRKIEKRLREREEPRRRISRGLCR